MEHAKLPPLLRMPPEIRLHIYSFLLVDEPSLGPHEVNIYSTPDYHEYEESPSTIDPAARRILNFRTVLPQTFDIKRHQAEKLRAPYKIRSGRFRAECMDVTYSCVNLPDLHPTVLGTNKQIHAEAARLLYTSYTFAFDTNVEACIPFFNDLTPYSRSFIRRMGLVKKAMAYDKDFDRCEWQNTCRYVAENLALNDLDLGVVAGRPIFGLDLIDPIPESDFPCLINQHKKDEMQWVRDLVAIKNLQHLHIHACIEHCPPPQSSALMFFVAFSASVDLGFKDYLHKQMMGPASMAAPIMIQA